MTLDKQREVWYYNKALDSCITCGGVAHLGERLNGIQEVVGSIPIVSTRKTGGNFVFPPVFFILRIFLYKIAPLWCIKKQFRWNICSGKCIKNPVQLRSYC